MDGEVPGDAEKKIIFIGPLSDPKGSGKSRVWSATSFLPFVRQQWVDFE